MKIIFNPQKKDAKDNEILIGLGTGKNSINKNSQFPSCAEFLYNNPIKYNSEKIYIEDFSPDTIITIYLLVHGEVDEKYIDYATHWEIGESDPDVYKSYGVLQYSLIETLKKDPTYRVEKSLEFLRFLIKKNYNLDNIPQNNNNLYKKAYNYLSKEYKEYTNIIQKSQTYYLFINNRKIKSIFLNNISITPLKKLLLRKEFDLIASFNEEYKGTGNDVVISVAPESGLNLKKLWEAIEIAETKAWKGKRPKDNPRKLVSPNIYNEPWWDDLGKYTLIAAPKKIGEEYGSKLKYEDIKEIILNTYKKEEDNK